jgi:hypothetical protein
MKAISEKHFKSNRNIRDGSSCPWHDKSHASRYVYLFYWPSVNGSQVQGWNFKITFS